MSKAMIFIDGSWLHRNTQPLGQKHGQSDFHIDYSKFPSVLIEAVAEQLSVPHIDLVRVCWYGSYPRNCSPEDEPAARRQCDFFDRLREDFGFDVTTFPIDFAGRRLRAYDRDDRDIFSPHEKCVDVALASDLVYYAAQPGCIDVVIPVIGDRDYLPALRIARSLGKRVGLASIQDSCSSVYQQTDACRPCDGPPLFLDDLLDKIELRFERRRLKCESPQHQGTPYVWTTFQPRKGQSFFCGECRQRHARRRAEVLDSLDLTAEQADLPEGRVAGAVVKLLPKRDYGFLTDPDGKDYFFHASSLEAGLTFDELVFGQKLSFQIEKEPSASEAGRAVSVRPIRVDAHRLDAA